MSRGAVTPERHPPHTPPPPAKQNRRVPTWPRGRHGPRAGVRLPGPGATWGLSRPVGGKTPRSTHQPNYRPARQPALTAAWPWALVRWTARGAALLSAHHAHPPAGPGITRLAHGEYGQTSPSLLPGPKTGSAGAGMGISSRSPHWRHWSGVAARDPAIGHSPNGHRLLHPGSFINDQPKVNEWAIPEVWGRVRLLPGLIATAQVKPFQSQGDSEAPSAALSALHSSAPCPPQPLPANHGAGTTVNH